MADDNPGGDYTGARWSLNLARPPGWLAGQDQRIINWYHDNLFDRNLDPNITLEQWVKEYRAQAAGFGVRVDDGDGPVLVNVAALQLGMVTWLGIAGAAGTTGPNNILDQKYANETAIVNAARAAGATDGTDSILLAAAGVTDEHPAVLTPSSFITPIQRGSVGPDRAAADSSSWGQDSSSRPMDFGLADNGGGGLFGGSSIVVLLIAAGAAWFVLKGGES